MRQRLFSVAYYSHAVSIYTLVPGDRLDPGEKLVIGCRKATISAETQKGETEAVNGCKVGSIEATIERDREVSPEVWISRAFEADNGLNDNSEFTIENEDETNQAKGVGVFGNNAQDTNIPVEVWRYYLLTNRPKVSDILFTWIDLQAKLNTELLNNLGNFINRVLSFISKDPDSRGGRAIAGQVAALVLCHTRELAYHVIFSFVTLQQFENVNFHPCLTLCILGEICCRELAYQEKLLIDVSGWLHQYIRVKKKVRLVKNKDNNEIKGFCINFVKNYGQKCMLSGLKAELEALRRRHSNVLELMGERDEEVKLPFQCFEVFDGKK
ncbi:unnamed protein product [Lactuca saligna]|uniref:Methionyl/Leucyl tRNA synthetase domain-containing protein n=1 Tax=Lactuca saligna TaxID=75948 RepID=A0AA35V5V9_LACSI|nr:unnamed protein product [Lactuca saligna]